MEVISPGSYWFAEHPPTSRFPELSTTLHVDVAIIGAGIAGLTTALHLKRAGLQVAVLEAGLVGAGTTGGTTAHLDVMPDCGMTKLMDTVGAESCQQITSLRAQAIDQIENWTAELGIQCDFRRIPAIAYTEDPERIKDNQAERLAAARAGVAVGDCVDPGLPFPVAGAFEISNQGRIHAIHYLEGIAKAVQGGAAQIFENSPAQIPHEGRPCQVDVLGHQVFATHVVVATHSAFLGISQLDMRQAPYQSYVVAVRVGQKIPDALYWDDNQPYHYSRRASSHDPRLLIIGGADHKTGQADGWEHVRKLEGYVHRRYQVERIERSWSAELFEPADGLPFIGRVPTTDHLWIATGFSGTGMTYGTAAGKIIADSILGESSKQWDVFSPARFKPLAEAKELVNENLNVLKHFVGDRLSAEALDTLNVIQRGEGRIVRINGTACAAYRDDRNQLHCLSPVCTHAGCFVQWNNVENTWDCPCHGGRYAATGERIYGPPPADLKPITRSS